MAYCMQQRGQRFTIKPNLKADALAAVKASAKKRAQSADATHEHRSFAETMSKLETLEEALEAWGWQLMESSNGAPGSNHCRCAAAVGAEWLTPRPNERSANRWAEKVKAPRKRLRFVVPEAEPAGLSRGEAVIRERMRLEVRQKVSPRSRVVSSGLLGCEYVEDAP